MRIFFWYAENHFDMILYKQLCIWMEAVGLQWQCHKIKSLKQRVTKFHINGISIIYSYHISIVNFSYTHDYLCGTCEVSLNTKGYGSYLSTKQSAKEA